MCSWVPKSWSGSIIARISLPITKLALLPAAWALCRRSISTSLPASPAWLITLVWAMDNFVSMDWNLDPPLSLRASRSGLSAIAGSIHSCHAALSPSLAARITLFTHLTSKSPHLVSLAMVPQWSCPLPCEIPSEHRPQWRSTETYCHLSISWASPWWWKTWRRPTWSGGLSGGPGGPEVPSMDTCRQDSPTSISQPCHLWGPSCPWTSWTTCHLVLGLLWICFINSAISSASWL